MGKRSAFPRQDRDFYATPTEAVAPLIPFLRRDRVRRFAEPCDGAGDLVRHLKSFGFTCCYRGDINTGQDALATSDYGEPDAICTNPPFRRDQLHPLIRHFVAIAPTWLLLPVDFASNRRDAPYLAACTDVVPIGRLKWIADSRHTGKDNFGWFRFQPDHVGGPVIHPRDATPAAPWVRRCAQCGEPHPMHRSGTLFCSNACRQRAYRDRLRVTQSVTPTAPGPDAGNRREQRP